MIQRRGISWSSLAFALFAWSLLILRFGYRFGTGDQVELLPYTLFLHDNSLYPHDFFIQALNQSVPNERTVMATLLLPFVNCLELTCFILHLLSTVILVLGLERLAGRFIRNRYLAWFAILCALIPLNDFTLGNVELYSDCFQASALATAIVVWAINLFLEKRYTHSSVLLSLATFIQLLEGLDVMIVLSGILFFALVRKEESIKTFLRFTGIYAITAGLYLMLILKQKTVAAPISDSELFAILFQFRHPHHFIFSTFPKPKVIVFFLLSGAAVLFYALRSRQLFQFVVIGLTGILLYAFMVDGLHNIFIGNFQFYKVTQWMKFSGTIALVALVEESLSFNLPAISRRVEAVLLPVAAVLCLVVTVWFNSYLPWKVPFQLFGMKECDDMISICEQVKKTVTPNAVFIQPFENTELKFYGQRSSYVEFKANVRNRKNVAEWYRRIQLVYYVSVKEAGKGFRLEHDANDYFFNGLQAEDLAVLKREGVTHILTRKEFPVSGGTLILWNGTYAVYQL
jgi:hypothetical protein